MDTVQAYRKDLIKNYSVATVNKRLSAIRARLRYMAETVQDRKAFFLIREGIKKIKNIKQATCAVSRDKVLDLNELELLKEKTSERNALFIEFLSLTGCRVSEMINIQYRDCKQLYNRCEIGVIGKGGKARKVLIPERLFNEIRDTFKGRNYIFETAGGKPYRRQYISDRIKKLGKRHLKKNISAHSMRHTFATRKIKSTGNLKGVSVYLGHASTKTTGDMYDHNQLTWAELRAV